MTSKWCEHYSWKVCFYSIHSKQDDNATKRLGLTESEEIEKTSVRKDNKKAGVKKTQDGVLFKYLVIVNGTNYTREMSRRYGYM